MGALSWLRGGSKNKGAVATMEGTLNTGWPANWWQRNLKPYHNDSCAVQSACTDAYAQAMALLWPQHYRLKNNGEKEYLYNTKAIQILKRPNAYQTRSDLILNLIKNLMSEGNGYLVGVRDDSGREFSSVHVMPARSCHPYIENESKTIFYGVGNNPLVPRDISALIPARDVLALRLYTPFNPLIGVSPVVNAAASIAANQAITGHQAAFFNNMARPSGVLSTDTILTKEQINTLRASWKEQSTGMDSGEIPILAGGMKWQALGITSQDGQLVGAFKMTVEDIARAYRVPLPLVGDYANSTYNNVEQLISAWLATGLGFVLEHVELALDRFFQLPPDQHIEFDTDSLLRTDFAGRIDGLTKGINGGLYAINEARAREGLPPVEHGGEIMLQQQVVPLGWWDEQSPPPSSETDPAANPPVDDVAEQDKNIAALMRLIGPCDPVVTKEGLIYG